MTDERNYSVVSLGFRRGSLTLKMALKLSSKMKLARIFYRDGTQVYPEK